MTMSIPKFLSDNIELYRCPSCAGDLHIADGSLSCVNCRQGFPITNGIPQLFWPDDKEVEDGSDVTETVKAFYEETPFPDYDDFDDIASLARKAGEANKARLSIPVNHRARKVRRVVWTGTPREFEFESCSVRSKRLCERPARNGVDRFATYTAGLSPQLSLIVSD